jgi:hypothetical protein
MGYRLFRFAGACLLALASEAHASQDLTGAVRILTDDSGAMVRRNHFMPWRPLAPKARVPEESEVRCSVTCTVKVDEDNTLVLSPDAVVSVGNLLFVPLIAGAPSLARAHQVELRAGSLEAISPSDRALPLVITAGPAQHIALRNARVQIVLRGDRAAVGVQSGQARVGASRNWVTLEKGQASAAPSVGPPPAPHPLTAGPVWSASETCPPAIGVAESKGGAPAGGCWTGVAGAHYQVELARDHDFHDLLGPADTLERPEWSRVLPAGRYFTRVRAIDADGLIGEHSVGRQLAIIPLVLPPGATANLTDRTLVVPEGRDVQFGDPKGLELAVDKSGFSNAPSSLRMDGEPEHQLRFRLKDDPSSTSTVLFVRRALKASVQITPRFARWPGDAIQISVTLEDPSGYSDPSKVQAQLKVTVGMHEVAVKWSHQGATWSTRLEPQRHVAPTVIRVIAQDEFGTPLGRNFLEVDKTEPLVAAR